MIQNECSCSYQLSPLEEHNSKCVPECGKIKKMGKKWKKWGNFNDRNGIYIRKKNMCKKYL